MNSHLKRVLVPLRFQQQHQQQTQLFKKIIGSDKTTLTFSSEELNYNIIIMRSLEDSGLLIKGVTETFENEIKEQTGGFLGMLAATLGANLLGNMLAGKSALRAGKGTTRASKAMIRPGQYF